MAGQGRGLAGVSMGPHGHLVFQQKLAVTVTDQGCVDHDIYCNGNVTAEAQRDVTSTTEYMGTKGWCGDEKRYRKQRSRNRYLNGS